MDEDRTSQHPSRLTRVVEKLSRVVELLHVATSSINNALHSAIDQFSMIHGDLKAQNDRMERKLDLLLRERGIVYREPAPPPPDEMSGPRNGEDAE